MEQRAKPTRERWRRDVLDQKRDALAAAFARHGVIAAYVFGSLARGRDPGRVTDGSDLDLAILLPWSLSEEERWHRARALEPELWGILGRGDVDLVVANDAEIVLRHHITKERDILYGRDAPERVGFDWHTLREYLDTEPLRRIRYSVVLRRAREGTFGVRSGTGSTPTR